MRFLYLFHTLFLLLCLDVFAQADKNVLLEEFSTAQCGFCPEGGIIAEKLIHKYPHLYTFTHHAGFGTDSMTIPESNTIAGKYTTFAPAAVIDRGYYPIPVYTYSGYIGVSRQKWDSIVALRLNEPAQAQVNLDYNYESSSRLLYAKVSITFLEQLPDNDYRINLAIIEDSVTGKGHGYDQKNYFNNDPTYPELYKKGDSIAGYVHRHVIRALPTGTWGLSTVIPRQPTVNIEYNYELKNYNLTAGWKERNINLIAFVSYYDKDSVYKHKVLNSIEFPLLKEPESVGESESATQFEDINIFPNPANDLLYIRLKDEFASVKSAEITDQTGIKIRTVTLSENMQRNYLYLSVSDLNDGLYFLRINTRHNFVLSKFIVLH